MSFSSGDCQLVCGERVLSRTRAPLRSRVCLCWFTPVSAGSASASHAFSLQSSCDRRTGAGPNKGWASGSIAHAARVCASSARALLLSRRTRRLSRQMHTAIHERHCARGPNLLHTGLHRRRREIKSILSHFWLDGGSARKLCKN